MSVLILVRHGESQWNLENRFTGWVDVDLSDEGKREAHEAGKLLKKYKIDYVFTSALKRAINTTDIILSEMGLGHMPYISNQALNERHYGDLQGLNKADTAEKFGADQVKVWRRSYDIAPPNGESLKDTQMRVMPYYLDVIEPLLRNGKNVLVSAHGNSLRSLVMHIEKLEPKQVLELNIGTGVPYIYEFDKDMKVIAKKILDKTEVDN